MPTELSTDSNTLIELAEVGGAGGRGMGMPGVCSSGAARPAARYRSTVGCPCLSPPPPLPLPLQLSTCPQKLGGYFSLADAAASTGWQEERLREALGAMAREGLVLIDDPPGESGAVVWIGGRGGG